jgi:hypothetical protein
MTLLLRSILMADELPTGDKAVFAFFELLAIGAAGESFAKFSASNPWQGILLLAITAVLFLFGLKWAAIKKSIGTGTSATIDAIIKDYRWRLIIIAASLVLFYFIEHN